MTPIGHLTSSAVVAGSAGLLKPREMKWATAWYAFWFLAFSIAIRIWGPGMWGMHFYDTFSDVPFYLLLIIWFRSKERRRQLTLGILIGGLVLAAYSHLFDKAYLLFMDKLPEGMFRPHNMIHSPFFGIALSAIFAPLLAKLMKMKRVLPMFTVLVLGYMLHITMDTITYHYPIYWLWPFSDFHYTFITAFTAPDAHSAANWLGDPFFVASPPVRNNPDGYVIYWSEPLINMLLLAFYWMVIGVKQLAGTVEPVPAKVRAPTADDVPATAAEPA